MIVRPHDDELICDLGLPARARTAFHHMGLTSVGAVRAIGAKELSRSPGFGVTTIKHIEAVILDWRVPSEANCSKLSKHAAQLRVVEAQRDAALAELSKLKRQLRELCGRT